jgi:hypothetical protein
VPEPKELVRRSLGEVGLLTFESLYDPLPGSVFISPVPGVIIALLLNPWLTSKIPAGIITRQSMPMQLLPDAFFSQPDLEPLQKLNP